MSVQFTETVYSGRANLYEWQLKEDGVALDSDDITDVILRVNGTCYTLTSPYIDLEPSGVVVMSLGLLGLPLGTHLGQLSVKTVPQPEGIAFGSVTLKVVTWSICA